MTRVEEVMSSFELIATSDKARAGVLHTPNGDVPTPVFVPVATQASVKTVTPSELRQVGATMLLGNTYHLYLRPGIDTMRNMGGLAKFMGWDGPTLTDSGGFQAYSLGSRVEVKDGGLQFQSHLDGKLHFFSAENVMAYQHAIGADFAMVLEISW